MDALLAAAAKAASDAGVVPEGKSDMAAMAEEMGMDPETMNKQAQQIWSMLDEMSSSDPGGYQKFIAKQTEDAAIADKPHIFPKPGFAIKTVYKPPKEDLGVRVFVNVCHHVAVNAPMTSSGQCVINKKGETIAGLPVNLSTAGLQIPLVVGEIRELKKAGEKNSGALEWVVDVIVHPWVLLKVTKDNTFKTSLTELAFNCILEEVGMKLKKVKYKFLKGYKGLMASGRPAPYLLEVEKARKKNRDAGIKPKPPRSSHAKEAAEKKRAEFNKKKKEYMKSMPPGGVPGVPATAGMAGASSGAPVGGAPPKATTMDSPMDLLKSIQANASLGAQIREASTAGRGAGGGAGAGAGSLESKSDDRAAGAAESKEASAPPAAAPAPVPAPARATKKSRPVIEEVLDTPEFSIKTGKDGEGTITVVVKLPGVDKFDGIELDVAEQTFKVVAPGKYELDTKLPCKVDHAAARAKFSKKKNRLSVTLPVV